MKNKEPESWIPSQFTKDEYIEVEEFWRHGIYGEKLPDTEERKMKKLTRPMRDVLFLIIAVIAFGFLLKSIELAVGRANAEVTYETPWRVFLLIGTEEQHSVWVRINDTHPWKFQNDGRHEYRIMEGYSMEHAQQTGAGFLEGNITRRKPCKDCPEFEETP